MTSKNKESQEPVTMESLLQTYSKIMKEVTYKNDYVIYINTDSFLFSAIQEINKDYPHQCPNCGSNAYIGFNSIDCINDCKGEVR